MKKVLLFSTAFLLAALVLAGPLFAKLSADDWTSAKKKLHKLTKIYILQERAAEAKRIEFKEFEWKNYKDVQGVEKMRKELQALNAQRDATAEKLTEVMNYIARDNSKRCLSELLKTAEYVNDPDAFAACLNAIASLSHKDALKEIESILLDKKPKKNKQKIILVESVGRMDEFDGKYKMLLDSLIMHLDLKGSKLEASRAVIFTLIDIIGKSGTNSKDDVRFIDALVETIKKFDKTRGRAWTDARSAIEKMTGIKLTTAEEYEFWWKKNRGTWAGKTGKVETPSPSNGKIKTGIGPKLFGNTITSRAVIFILDTSGSMTMRDPVDPIEEKANEQEPRTTVVKPKRKPPKKDPNGTDLPPERERLYRAKKELMTVMKNIAPGTQFNIIAYARKCTIFSEDGMKTMNSANRRKAIAFIESFSAIETTHTDDALEMAFEKNDSVDTIYLLSDGAPTHRGDRSDSEMIVKEILSYVAKHNKLRKIKIHAMGFPGAHRRFMMTLARENNGTYKDIK